MIEFSRKFFQKNYTLTENAVPIGSISHTFFHRTYNSKLNQSEYIFTRIPGFLKKFAVSSISENNLAEIRFPFWRNKATIILKNGAVYQWEQINFFSGSCRISQRGKQILKFSESFRKGVITGDTTNDLLVISGLIVEDYKKFTATIILVIVLPILMRQTLFELLSFNYFKN